MVSEHQHPLQYRNQCLFIYLNSAHPWTTWRHQLCRVVDERVEQDQRQKTLGLHLWNKGCTRKQEIWWIWSMGRWKMPSQVLTKEIKSLFICLAMTKDIWDSVQQTYSINQDASRSYQLYREVISTQQNGDSVITYFGKLQRLWL